MLQQQDVLNMTGTFSHCQFIQKMTINDSPRSDHWHKPNFFQQQDFIFVPKVYRDQDHSTEDYITASDMSNQVNE